MRLGDLDALKAYVKHTDLTAKEKVALLFAIAEQPTIDAVEVVRCKECKRSAWRKSPFGVQTFTCELLCADIKPDDFCSYGERKGE